MTNVSEVVFNVFAVLLFRFQHFISYFFLLLNPLIEMPILYGLIAMFSWIHVNKQSIGRQ